MSLKSHVKYTTILYAQCRCMAIPTSLVNEGTIRRGRRMLEHNLIRGRTINVAESRQSRRTLVKSNQQSKLASPQATACHYHVTGKRLVIHKIMKSFRSTLRSLVNRKSIESDHKSADSHTRHSDLTSAEKQERIRKIPCTFELSKQKVKRLQDKVDKLITEKLVHLQNSDTTNIAQIVKEVSLLVEERFPLNSLQRVLWDQQRRYNSLKDKRQMRWHPLVIRFALNLKYLSGTAYRAVHQSGLINLASERTLSDYTHWTTPHSWLSKCLCSLQELSSNYHCQFPQLIISVLV